MDFLNYLLGEQTSIEKEKKIVEYISSSRYSSFISTDKPIYKLEDNVFVKIVVLHSNLLTPLHDSQYPPYCSVKLFGPKNDELESFFIDFCQDSTYSLSIQIQNTYSGAKYKLVASFSKDVVGCEREFEVRQFQNPRLNSHIEFIRKGYGEGDKVMATLESHRVEGGFPENAKVEASATIDEQVVWKETYKLNENGSCLLQFTLPKKIEKGDGSVTCIIHDGGITETATKTIPIFLKNIDIKIYPEGGDLVENLESRFYIEALTSYGEPADIQAEIITEKNKVVGEIITKHEGRGRSSFTPQPNQKYFLRVIKPSGITKLISLPSAKESGAVLTSLEDVFEADTMKQFTLQATKSGTYYVSIFKREIELSRIKVNIEKEKFKKDIVFSTPSNASGSGVLRVLVTDGKIPLAERLIFVKPSNSIHTTISPKFHKYSPRETVTAEIQTRDSYGNSIDTVLGVIVTDLSVIETLEKRKRPPTLPSMIYFENEVEHLEDSEIYLSNDQKSDLCVDLLLGTQGWRRFCFQNPHQFLKDKKEKAERVLAFTDKIELIEDLNIEGENKINYIGIFNKDGSIIEQRFFTRSPKNNFKKTIRDIISNSQLSTYTKNSIISDFIKFDYIYDEERFYFSVSNQSSRIIFQILESIQKSKTLNNLNLNPFIKEDKLEKVKSQIDETKSLMIQNIDKLLERGERLDSLIEDTSILESESRQFSKSASKFKAPNLFGNISNPFSGMNLFQNNTPNPPKNELKSVEKIQTLEESKTTKKQNQSSQKNDLYIREYAFKSKKGKTRSDFTETLFYAASIQTKNGKASITFDLSDSITSYSILTEGFSKDGLIGGNSLTIQCSEPFYIEPKLPLEVCMGDVMKIPLYFINNSQENNNIEYSTFAMTNLISITENIKGNVYVKSNERKREIIEMKAKDSSESPVTFTAKSDLGHKDQVSGNIKIVPNGFPITCSVSGKIIKGSRKFTIPIQKLINDSLVASFNIYKSLEKNIFSACDQLVIEPHGCFEQTSATSYPLVMAYPILLKKDPVDTTQLKRAISIIQGSYKKLSSYECKNGGFEWFGNGDGVETLTAYGILQFTEMSKIIEIDQNLINRSLTWLLNRRDGKGGFQINSEKSYQLSHGNIPPLVSNAYILWALTEAKCIGLENEIKVLYNDALKSSDSYIIALASIVLFNAGEIDKSEKLGERLLKNQENDGSIKGGSYTITKSTGTNLTVEVTALTILAWTKLQKFSKEKAEAVKYIHSCCKFGAYGSTQSTVLSLKAIIENNSSLNQSFILTLKFNDKSLSMEMKNTTTESISLIDYFKEGDNEVEIISSENSFPFSLDVKYRSILPKDSENSIIDLETSLSKEEFKEGESGHISFNLTNLSKNNQAMTVVVLSLPGGLEPNHEKLKEMIKDGKFDFYEIIGRSIIIYFKYLEGNQKISLNINIIARIPGKYEGQANRAYIYYSPENIKYTNGLKCSIEPNKNE